MVVQAAVSSRGEKCDHSVRCALDLGGRNANVSCYSNATAPPHLRTAPLHIAGMSRVLLDDIKPLTRAPLVDPFGRDISYLRISVTDRCDFRCVYCMSEDMTFLPKRDLLTLEEIDRVATAFVARGTRKLRLTGGEPLVRRDIMSLFRSLSRHLTSGALEELTLTTNGSLLARYAEELADYGVRRINVSLDTLDPDKFRKITRWGDLDKVLAGIEAARKAGMRVKINAVALKGVNEDEIEGLMLGARARHGPDPDRGDADRRDRARPDRPVPAALGRAGTA
jgi:sulfatase maturation enzyme AslB (radical SAM superfamily)